MINNIWKWLRSRPIKLVLRQKVKVKLSHLYRVSLVELTGFGHVCYVTMVELTMCFPWPRVSWLGEILVAGKTRSNAGVWGVAMVMVSGLLKQHGYDGVLLVEFTVIVHWLVDGLHWAGPRIIHGHVVHRVAVGVQVGVGGEGVMGVVLSIFSSGVWRGRGSWMLVIIRQIGRIAALELIWILERENK